MLHSVGSFVGAIMSGDSSAAIQAIVAIAALLFAVGSFVLANAFSRSSKQQDLTMELWKQWSSADYRRFRVKASRNVKGGLEHSTIPEAEKPYSVVASNLEDELAIGSIEHFIIDAANVYGRNLINKELFDALFESTLNDWRGIFSKIARDGPQSKQISVELEKAFKVLLDSSYNA